MATTETATWRQYATIRADWRAVVLVGLFLLVIGGALALRPVLLAGGTESAVAGASAAEQAGGGAVWALAEAIFAGLLLAGLYLYQRTPEWVQHVVRRALRVGFWVAVGFYAAGVAGATMGLLGVVAAVALIEVAKQQRLYWLVNDILALGLAVVMAAVVGVKLGPVFVGVGLIGLSIYDHWFADRKTWMFDLAGWMLRWKLPVLVVLPTTLRFDWDALTSATDEETDPEDINFGFGIGMADLLLPAALAVGVASAGGGLPVLGVVVGTLAACFRLSHKIHERGGAGLPPLTVGALGGWAVASVVALAALGGV